jgi:adenylyltransferase/sulfurtransferase
MKTFPPAVLKEMAAHAQKAYPAECCGLLLEDAGGALLFRPVANVAGSAQARDVSTRSVRDGYVMDPMGLMAAQDEADRLGGRIWAVVHSHPDVGAYFSAEDRKKALDETGREPVWPGVHYVVISTRASGVDGARLFTWDAGKQDFTEREIPGITQDS